MEKTILGHIDCPTCGAAGGMRITHDKNQEPFGYCEAGCGQQLRIGGNPARVRMFVARHPFAGKPGAAPVTVTDTGTVAPEKPVTVEERAAKANRIGEREAKPVTEQIQQPQPKRKATFADALGVLGVR